MPANNLPLDVGDHVKRVIDRHGTSAYVKILWGERR
jgi:hypothetical protein